MNMEEAEKIADKMSYREAVMNCLCARCVPYRKATKIKMKRLLESIDALNIDLDTPMHFTPEQKAWVKKYIAINGERQRVEGAREFAEWLCKKSDYTDIYINGFVTCGCGFSPRDTTIEQALKEWQKGKEDTL